MLRNGGCRLPFPVASASLIHRCYGVDMCRKQRRTGFITTKADIIIDCSRMLSANDVSSHRMPRYEIQWCQTANLQRCKLPGPLAKLTTALLRADLLKAMRIQLFTAGKPSTYIAASSI